MFGADSPLWINMAAHDAGRIAGKIAGEQTAQNWRKYHDEQMAIAKAEYDHLDEIAGAKIKAYEAVLVELEKSLPTHPMFQKVQARNKAGQLVTRNRWVNRFVEVQDHFLRLWGRDPITGQKKAA